MDTEHERREAREEERRQAELDRERRADHAPGRPVLRTPREEVAAYVERAARCFRGPGDVEVAGVLRWLDRAREVLESPNLIDGAALLRSTVQEALDAAEEGDSASVIGRLEEAVALLDRQVRPAPGEEIPVARADFERDDAAVKRDAVRAVLKRYELEAWAALGEQVLADEAVDEIIAAAETGI